MATLFENSPLNVLWRFDYARSMVAYSQEDRDRMTEFLDRHGIGLVLEGTSVFVAERPDGTLFVDTWQIADREKLTAASDVPNAIKQERVQVDLIGDPPEMVDAQDFRTPDEALGSD